MTAANELSRDDRAERLDDAIAEYVMQNGGRVEERSALRAVIVHDNSLAGGAHVVLALLTIFTCGLFAIVWIIAAWPREPKRVSLTVDKQGHVTTSDAASVAK